MKTAVEWLQIMLIPTPYDEEDVEHNKKCWEQALEMEKEQLLNMSLMSAHYERKWILEHSTESKYNPSKIEIRDLEKTALEHYNETFKEQEQ
jgi:hypothetical protein